jgi:hypothetical protein
MSFFIFEKHDLLGLELSVLILNFDLGKLVGLADVFVVVEHLVIEVLGKLNSGLVEDCLVLVNADDVGNSSFNEDASNLLRMTACYIHKLQVRVLLEAYVLIVSSVHPLKSRFDVFEHLLKIRSKEEIGGSILVFKDQHVSLVLVSHPRLLVFLVKLLVVLETMP